MRVNMNDGDDVKRLREESRGERFVTHVDLTEPLIVSIPSMLHVKWNERESVANVFSNISISWCKSNLSKNVIKIVSISNS